MDIRPLLYFFGSVYRVYHRVGTAVPDRNLRERSCVIRRLPYAITPLLRCESAITRWLAVAPRKEREEEAEPGRERHIECWATRYELGVDIFWDRDANPWEA